VGSGSCGGICWFHGCKKIELVKVEIQKWHEEVFGDLKSREYNLMDFINQLDVKEEASGLSNEELEKRKIAANEVAELF